MQYRRRMQQVDNAARNVMHRNVQNAANRECSVSAHVYQCDTMRLTKCIANATTDNATLCTWQHRMQRIAHATVF